MEYGLGETDLRREELPVALRRRLRRCRDGRLSRRSGAGRVLEWRTSVEGGQDVIEVRGTALKKS